MRATGGRFCTPFIFTLDAPPVSVHLCVTIPYPAPGERRHAEETRTMLTKNRLARPGAFLRGLGRVLDLGGALAADGWPEPPGSDAAALLDDWDALASDQRRAWDQLSAELRGTFDGKSP